MNADTFVTGPRHGTRYHWRKGCRCHECHDAIKRHAADMNEKRRNGTAKRTVGRPSVAGVGPVRCACGQKCPNRTALGAHTWTAHDRPPTDTERTIIAATRVAA